MFPTGVLGHYASDTSLARGIVRGQHLAGFAPVVRTVDDGVLPGALTFIGDQHTELAPGTPNYDLLGVRTVGGVTTWGVVSQDKVAPAGRFPALDERPSSTRLLFDSGRPESLAFFNEHSQETDADGVFYHVPYARALTRLQVLIHATMSDATDQLRPVVTSTTLTRHCQALQGQHAAVGVADALTSATHRLRRTTRRGVSVQILFSQQSAYQHVQIVESQAGVVDLILDGVFQTTLPNDGYYATLLGPNNGLSTLILGGGDNRRS